MEIKPLPGNGNGGFFTTLSNNKSFEKKIRDHERHTLCVALGSFKADSHIACRAHAVPLPCRAARFRMSLSHLIYTARPCLIHTCHAIPMPRPCRALTMPFFSRPRHSTAVERRPVGYLPAFGFFRLTRGVPRRLLSEAHPSSSQRSIPTTVKSGSSTLQKRRSVKLLD
jgi:hypothetical protein